MNCSNIRQDAERYRHLRAVWSGRHNRTKAQIDAAIDRDMIGNGAISLEPQASNADLKQ
jgi:hypothetical protein